MMCLVRTVRVRELVDGFLYARVTDWSKKFPEANGQHQSPINLVSDNAEYDPTLTERPLTINYATSRETDILNDGQTVIVYPKYRGVISGGPMIDGHQYELSEIRFHWGRLSTKGSEHKCNGKAFPMEVQMIHWNTDLYANYEEAVGKEGGIVNFGLFVQIGREHPGIKSLFSDTMVDIFYKVHVFLRNGEIINFTFAERPVYTVGQQSVIDEYVHLGQKGRQKTTNVSFNPSTLLPDPELRDFWVYEGSLTSPPCYENVTWILFRYPLMLSSEQVDDFRHLKTYAKGDKPPPGHDGRLVDNFRPVQPLNDRKVRASFQWM